MEMKIINQRTQEPHQDAKSPNAETMESSTSPGNSSVPQNMGWMYHVESLTRSMQKYAETTKSEYKLERLSHAGWGEKLDQHAYRR